MKIQSQADVDRVIEEVLINCRVINVEETIPKRNRRYRRRAEDLHLVNSLAQKWDTEELVVATAADPVLSVLLTWRVRPEWPEVSPLSPELKYYWQVWDQWRQDSHGLLWYRWMESKNLIGQWKLLMPHCFRPQLLASVHDAPSSSHFGEKRSVASLLWIPVFWFGFKADMRLYCRTCDDCLRCKPVLRRSHAPMASFQVGAPLERMAIDVAGPFHTSKGGNSYIIVVMDYFTKWAEMIAVPDHTAETCAKALVLRVFSRIGLPRSLHSDQGRDFLSNLFTMLRLYVDRDQSDWDEWLPLCNMAYNGSVHSSSGYSPFFMMYGRDLRLPVEMVLPSPDFQTESRQGENSADQFVRKLTNVFHHVYGLVRINLQVATNLQKRQYDKKGVAREFKVGQGVWLYNPRRRVGRTPKLDVPWEGPFAVVSIIGNVLCQIQSSRRTKARIVHVDKLVPVRGQYDGAWVHGLPSKMEAQFCDEHLDGLAKMFKHPQPAARPVEPVAGADGGDAHVAGADRVDAPVAGADGGNVPVSVPEVYKGPQTRSRANRS